ncbi:MAG: cobalamin biosynthesis protein, partial [Chromatiaceae bacterium]|nr:cobalamin biosynthesis protein [Chromatiaceae bacterium]
MALSEHLLLILAACALDALLGDPVYRLHPIRVLGAWTLACERWLFALGLDGRLGGVLLWIATVGGALGGWWLVHAGLILLHPWLAFVWDLFIAYSLLCARDLLNQGRRVLLALDDLPLARRELQMLVSRDTETLPRAGVVRATIESLSENLTDGVLTPLWALCLFGLPGLILVKVVSNLDSMVGYKNARYARFGWAGARSD